MTSDAQAPLAALTTALLDYLSELAGYRDTCLAHAKTAAV
jgi:hypothetical protein